VEADVFVPLAARFICVIVERTNRRQRTHQGHATARDPAFFHCSASSMQGVFNNDPAFLHLDLGRGIDLDHGLAAAELGNALLQLFLVVVRRGLFDLRDDLLDTRPDAVGRADAVDDRGAATSRPGL